MPGREPWRDQGRRETERPAREDIHRRDRAVRGEGRCERSTHARGAPNHKHPSTRGRHLDRRPSARRSDNNSRASRIRDSDIDQSREQAAARRDSDPRDARIPASQTLAEAEAPVALGTRSRRQVPRPLDARVAGQSRRDFSVHRDDCGSSQAVVSPAEAGTPACARGCRGRVGNYVATSGEFLVAAVTGGPACLGSGG